MRHAARVPVRHALCWFASLIAGAVSASGQCNPPLVYGSLSDGMGGPSGGMSLVAWDPDGAGPQPQQLVSAGAFTRVGSQNIARVAIYDGARWSQVGNGLNQVANAAAVFNGQLVVGGSFTGPGTGVGAINRVAVFDTTTQTWRQLGDGLNGTVWSLRVYNGQLYAAGFFSATVTAPATTGLNRVARFNTTNQKWEPVGSGIASSGTVYALGEYNGELYAGTDSFANSSLLVKFNAAGASWDPVGGGLTGSGVPLAVRVLTTATLNGQSRLFVGGNFQTINSGPGAGSVAGLASFDGTDLQALPGAFISSGSSSRPDVRDIKPFTYGGVQGLAISGFNISTAESGTVTNLNNSFFYDGSAASPLGADVTAGVAGGVNAGIVFGGSYYVTGPFADTGAPWGGSFVQTTAVGRGYGGAGTVRFDGAANRFVPLVGGFNGTVMAWGAWQGQPVAVGYFTAVDGNPARRVAVFDGTRWRGLGDGVGPVTGDFAREQGLFAVAEYNGKLVVGGNTIQEYIDSGSTGSHLWQWDPATSVWSKLGGGVNSLVHALLVKDGSLYVGGTFTQANNAGRFRGIARWDGTNWFPVGDGFFRSAASVSTSSDPDLNGRRIGGAVYALLNDGGTLVAGGWFDRAGDDTAPVNALNVARLVGNSWAPMGSGVNTYNPAAVGLNPGVWTLARYGGQVVAGGAFNVVAPLTGTDIGPVNTNTGANPNGSTGANAGGVARFDGTEWLAMGGTAGLTVYGLSGPDAGTSLRVTRIASFGGRLYAAGEFSSALGAGMRFNALAQWDPSAIPATGGQGDWQSVGTGLSYGVYALRGFGRELFAGGSFNTAGGTNPTVTTTGIPAFYAVKLRPCVADFDCSGTRGVDDIFIYLSAWFVNAPRSDVDDSGERTVGDIFVFLNLWFAGCT